MKFALANGRRQEAKKGLRGTCPFCGDPVLARCGPVRIWHWAHRPGHVCSDPFKENETEWHRNWKNQFPRDRQEIVRHAKDGEKHIADVQTSEGWVIEFQYSYIRPEEVRSREGFYSKLIWVVHGGRRDSDYFRLPGAWRYVATVSEDSPVRCIPVRGDALLRDWAGRSVHVLFDFGENEKGDERMLWWLSPKSDDNWAYVAPYPRAKFIENHLRTATQRARERDSFAREYVAAVAQDKQRLAQEALRAPKVLIRTRHKTYFRADDAVDLLPDPPRRWIPSQDFSRERMKEFLAAERERRLARTDGSPPSES
jgi:competence protein CoiA